MEYDIKDIFSLYDFIIKDIVIIDEKILVTNVCEMGM